ncbi:hypothetical protein FACS189494_01130 [Spirochaetia bacterium]|nr:hypothetical protein FACS189494_01130 [Spirochaetia bacterium]
MGLSIQALVDSAYKKIAASDYNGARQDFREAIGITPKDAIEYVDRGMAYNGLGDYDNAIENFNKAIQIDSRLDDPLVKLHEAVARRKADIGIRAMEGKPPKDANDQFNPKDAMDYYCRGLEYWYFAKTDLAIADFLKAIEINKDFIIAYGKLGHLYCDKENFDGAITAYSKALQINPNCKLEPHLANAYYCRGSTYLQNENISNAIADLSHAIRLDPNFADAHFNLGMAYLEGGIESDIDRSIGEFSLAIQCGFNMAMVYDNRGEAYRRKGRLADAIQDLEKAVSLEPNNEYYTKRLKKIKE